MKELRSVKKQGEHDQLKKKKKTWLNQQEQVLLEKQKKCRHSANIQIFMSMKTLFCALKQCHVRTGQGNLQMSGT